MRKSWCDSHINQPRLCIPTGEPSAGLAPSQVMLGRTAFTQSAALRSHSSKLNWSPALMGEFGSHLVLEVADQRCSM